jgi:ribosomal-protein-alanine N-acetyltransferase
VKFKIAPMTQSEAVAVTRWRYPDPYSFYDWTADPDDAALLLDSKGRKGRFFSVRDEQGELVGFFEFQQKGKDVVIGLGLHPDLTGRGLGREFLESGMVFAQRRFKPERFRLSVASFNKRAIKVYERAGFNMTRAFDHETNGGVYRFIEMARPA